MTDLVRSFNSVENPFFIESQEEGIELEKLRYRGRGESVYSDGRQVLVRSCHDALVSCNNPDGKRGILLIRRISEPANGYLWPLGGFFDRGVPTDESLASRIKNESGLVIDEDSYIVLGHIRALWKTTPNKDAEARGLPSGIDDTGLLFYVNGSGNLNLDKLHDRPRIVTPEMYTHELKSELHTYVRKGMDRAIPLLYQTR
mgnify:CR=1 FL=1